MKAHNSTRQTVLSDRLEIADTSFSRMKGLLGRKGLEAGQGLMITRCNSIHMFFMKFPIDVVFLDRKNRVVGVVNNIPPFALSPIFWSAVKVIELPPGTIATTDTRVGDELGFSH